MLAGIRTRGSDSGQNQEEKRGNKYKKEDRSSGLYRNGNRCDHRFRNFRFTAHQVINDIGTGIVLALLATIVYTLAKTIPNVYLSSVTPASGSFFIAPTKLIHPAVGVFMAAQNLLQPVLISVFAVLFGDYFCGAVPGAGRIQNADQYCDSADLYGNRMAGQSYLCVCQ